MVRNLVMAGISCFFCINTVTALDWMQCTTIERDAERLICYDAIAAESAGRHISSNEPDAEKDMIILRCREEMGEYGSATVKHCVDRDIAAYEELVTYPDSHTAFITRCIKEMGDYGWRTVKHCADRDIVAERALRGIQNTE